MICFNALITTQMAASDCHHLERRRRLTTPPFFFLSKGERERPREGKVKQQKREHLSVTDKIYLYLHATPKATPQLLDMLCFSSLWQVKLSLVYEPERCLCHLELSCRLNQSDKSKREQREGPSQCHRTTGAQRIMLFDLLFIKLHGDVLIFSALHSEWRLQFATQLNYVAECNMIMQMHGRWENLAFTHSDMQCIKSLIRPSFIDVSLNITRHVAKQCDLFFHSDLKLSNQDGILVCSQHIGRGDIQYRKSIQFSCRHNMRI